MNGVDVAQNTEECLAERSVDFLEVGNLPRGSVPSVNELAIFLETAAGMEQHRLALVIYPFCVHSLLPTALESLLDSVDNPVSHYKDTHGADVDCALVRFSEGGGALALLTAHRRLGLVWQMRYQLSIRAIPSLVNTTPTPCNEAFVSLEAHIDAAPCLAALRLRCLMECEHVRRSIMHGDTQSQDDSVNEDQTLLLPRMRTLANLLAETTGVRPVEVRQPLFFPATSPLFAEFLTRSVTGKLVVEGSLLQMAAVRDLIDTLTQLASNASSTAVCDSAGKSIGKMSLLFRNREFCNCGGMRVGSAHRECGSRMSQAGESVSKIDGECEQPEASDGRPMQTSTLDEADSNSLPATPSVGVNRPVPHMVDTCNVQSEVTLGEISNVNNEALLSSADGMCRTQEVHQQAFLNSDAGTTCECTDLADVAQSSNRSSVQAMTHFR